jgi:hypothetical protein
VPGSAELRRKLHAVESLSEVEDVFAEYLARPRYDSIEEVEESPAAA